MKMIICVLCLFLCSCHNHPDTDLMVWDYNDFISVNVKMSDIADEMTIIQPDSIDYKGARIVHASSFFLAGTEQGILKYDNQGHFIGRIGAIGQGPGEYSKFYTMAINETERIIYVYRMNTSELWSFSYDGTFLNKHSLQLPKEWAWSFYYLKDKFYFYYTVDADDESQFYMYAITDTIGNLLASKRDESLHFTSGNYPSFPSAHVGVFGDTMLVWNQYSDTIYRVSEKSEKAFAVWGKWGKRLTPAKVEKEEYYQIMILYTIVETIDYYLCVWRPFDIMKIRWNYCFYDKASGKLFNSEGLVDDLWGLPSFIPDNYYVMEGREYLECGYPTYKLLDAWLASDDPKIRKQAESIDEEGNNVLIRIRLKK
ncbi:6-bladed beta-propeller [Bacteroides oleiciplenus]|uniref:6-bladed beta-propeller n=3 Tax=Bacteroides oleiciplenus TaxID=626931 RepID=K9DYQ2_9BACE|nr:6-bladed beta-propeller [Bacteroides oleiciplenus]EKU89543.1 hypothetical protein HMPREF9447_02981 [Bacteroides oleiciplenus YIT 12058]